MSVPTWAGPVKPMTFAPQDEKFCRVVKHIGESQKVDVSGMTGIDKLITFIKRFIGGKNGD